MLLLVDIEIWKNNTKVGTGEVLLNNFFSADDELPSFKASKKCHVPIYKNKLVKELELVGNIDCLFILTGHDCIICRSCKKEFEGPSILKHLTQVKGCENTYSEEERQSFGRNSIKRKLKTSI